MSHAGRPPAKPERSARLPALAFGHARASSHLQPDELDDLMEQALGLRAAHRVPEPQQPFEGQAAQHAFNGLRLLALSSLALQQRVQAASHPVLVVPLQGCLRVEAEGRALKARANEEAVLLPAGARSMGLGGPQSSLWLTLDTSRLGRVAAAMLGDEEADRAGRLLGLDRLAILRLRLGRAHLGNVLRQLCRLLDAYAADATLLRLSAVDDAFCRALVTLLAPGHVSPQPPGAADPPRASRAAVDAVCEHVLAHLDSRLRLSDMERVSGLSARSLQYAFRQRFGCSPLGWVLEQRLQAAHDELCAAPHGATVTQVAVRYFSNPGRFSTQYRSRFGELPTATLARARSRRD